MLFDRYNISDKYKAADLVLTWYPAPPQYFVVLYEQRSIGNIGYSGNPFERERERNTISQRAMH